MSINRITGLIKANKQKMAAKNKITSLSDPAVPLNTPPALDANRADNLPANLKIAQARAKGRSLSPWLTKQPGIAVVADANNTADAPRKYKVMSTDDLANTKEGEILPQLEDPKVAKWSSEERLEKALKAKDVKPSKAQSREGAIISKALRGQIIDDYAKQQPNWTAKTIKKLRSEATKNVPGSEGAKLADELLKTAKGQVLETDVLNRDSLQFKETYKRQLSDNVIGADPRTIDPELKAIILEDIDSFSDAALNAVASTYGRGIKGLKKYEPPTRNAAVLGGGKRMLEHLVGDEGYSGLTERQRNEMGATLGALIEEPLLQSGTIKEYQVPLPPSQRNVMGQSAKIVREPSSAQLFDLLEESASKDIGVSFTEPFVWKKGRQSGKTLVKTWDNEFLKSLSDKDQPLLFESVNYIQSIPYQVAPRLLEQFKSLRAQGKKLFAVGLTPDEQNHMYQLRDYTSNVENEYYKMVSEKHKEITDTDAPKEIKKEAHKELDKQAAGMGLLSPNERAEFFNAQEQFRVLNGKNAKASDEETALGRAERILEFSQGQPMYFDVQLGDNGRVYYTFPVLNPQGSPVARTLLEYKDGQRLTDEGVENLKLELSSYIEEGDLKVAKIPPGQRMEWFNSNEDRLVRWSEDPVATFDEYADLVDIKNLPSFISALNDYNGWMNDPNFISHRQSAMDATTSGAQIITALLDDSTIAPMVNLVENLEKVGDLYVHAGDETIKLLEQQVRSGSNSAQFALDELTKVRDAGGFRTAFKRPLMVIPYGAGARTIAETITDDLADKGINIDPQAASIIGKVMNDNMTEIIPALGVFKSVIKRMTDKMFVEADWNEDGSAYRWESVEPTFHSTVGFPMKHTKDAVLLDEQIKVLQKGKQISIYPQRTEKQVGGRLKADAETALMAKFIHFLDANILMEYALRMKKAGLPVTVVHDQFGTNVNGASKQLEIIRDVMKDMFGGKKSEGARMLEKLITEATDKEGGKIWDLEDIQDLIERGDLDIDDTIDSARPFDFG